MLRSVCEVKFALKEPRSSGIAQRDDEEGAQRTIRGDPEYVRVEGEVEALESGRRTLFVGLGRYSTLKFGGRHIVGTWRFGECLSNEAGGPKDLWKNGTMLTSLKKVKNTEAALAVSFDLK